MATKETWIWGRIPAATCVGMLLVAAPACAVNRHVVRVHTQLQLLNDGLASRRQKMDRDFDTMTQLMQHNATTLESVSERVGKIQRAVGAFGRQQQFAAVVQQLEHLRKSAEELNGTLTEIQARAEAMNKIQYGALYPARIGEPEARDESGKDNPVKEPNP